MNELGDDSLRKRFLAWWTLVATQALLTVIVFGPTLQFAFREELATATGESQLLLAVLAFRVALRRPGSLAPTATLLLFAGWAGHYVRYVEEMYSYLFTDTYFIPLLIAGANVIALRGTRLIWSDVRQEPPAVAHFRTFSLRTLFGWIAAVAFGILIGQGAIRNTDVSGMSDPWEAIEFGIVGAPDHILFRLPLLAAALALYGYVWSRLIRIILSPDRGCHLGLRAAALFAGWFAGELILSAGVMCFEQPWPLLPAGMLTPVQICLNFQYQLWERQLDFHWWRRLPEFAVLAACRVVILGGSLVLLRVAGLRIQRTEEIRA